MNWLCDLSYLFGGAFLLIGAISAHMFGRFNSGNSPMGS